MKPAGGPSAAVTRGNIKAVFLGAVPTARFAGPWPSQTGLPALRAELALAAPRGACLGRWGSNAGYPLPGGVHLCGCPVPAEQPAPLFPKKLPGLHFL